ncbi:ArsR family transcriptional regulator [Paenibacillus sp. FSL R7-0273]|uniref:ArsR/SmtB family transcription factor n=1 Tax=Paenibacillus sp. FSL R7-0273 TaxID=1536772 RepID=UPI0004F65189|nr:winged helix-turn-helix transcriptional regulator [Paenibacillus sp. FSL R7-0273]AIQ46022.1 ArsR family transcriptional regulator [Paenibacillus sp. FSL R7-0273]OMF92851.1 ArsR family transcriptional regulator [Paenibacillus sp. FSL R7-0273]
MQELSIEDPDRLIAVAHALSTRPRVDILRLLNAGSLNIIEIAGRLELPVSTVASNVKVLEAAGLIRTASAPASRGSMKVCTSTSGNILISLGGPKAGSGGQTCVYEVDMPVGHYSDCETAPTCGMASAEGLIIREDEPAGFYHPKRISAQIIWLSRGYVEYLLPVDLPAGAELEALELSMELCSEAPNYDQSWTSDISVRVNGVEIGMWSCPGDFGDRRGRLNPQWWPDGSTQYGMLTVWRVEPGMTTLNQQKISDISLSMLQVKESPKVRLRIGVNPEAVNQGGLNLFGREFGDYAQNIIMKISYTLPAE